ncbi:MAG: hypothetical protein NT012_03060 [Candidatus Nealsonbacteria bacterium]|nr:hypothetical protein [Candidatus Nealsonbacteria bacterium]
MPEISQSTKKLIQKYQAWYQSLEKKENVSFIHVDEVASRVAEFYEKLRAIVDWQEEHLMKRGAIARTLKRRFLLAKEGKNISEPLILELIRGGHFPNDNIEETKIGDVEKILNKYIYILENNPSSSRAIAKGSEKQKMQLYNWLLSITACEIEEILSPSHKERDLIDYMTESMIDKIRVQQGVISIGGMTEEEKNRQIYIAVQRALFKLDSPIITYHLLKKREGQWADLPTAKLHEIAQNIFSIWESLEKELNHHLKDKFYKICERYDTPYLLLGDILISGENPAKIYEKISKPEDLEESIKKAYNKRSSTLKQRLFRAAVYSTLSIFLTNIAALYVLEIPLAKMTGRTFSPLTIVVDILESTFLMFLLVATIKPPSKSNLEIVLLETMKIIYKTEKTDIYEIKVPKKRGSLVKFFIALLYLIGASVSIGVIVAIFEWAKFPPTSMVINLISVALVAFAGLAIRNRGEELTVEEKKAGFFSFIFDILFLPIVGLGQWLSNKWKKYNAIAVFFSALVDLPFEIFIEFLEQWRYFLKEKKEEIH